MAVGAMSLICSSTSASFGFESSRIRRATSYLYSARLNGNKVNYSSPTFTDAHKWWFSGGWSESNRNIDARQSSLVSSDQYLLSSQCYNSIGYKFAACGKRRTSDGRSALSDRNVSRARAQSDHCGRVSRYLRNCGCRRSPSRIFGDNSSNGSDVCPTSGDNAGREPDSGSDFCGCAATQSDADASACLALSQPTQTNPNHPPHSPRGSVHSRDCRLYILTVDRSYPILGQYLKTHRSLDRSSGY